MWGILRRRFGCWEEIDQNDGEGPPTEVLQEIEAAAEAYGKVREEDRGRNALVVEYGEYVYRVRFDIEDGEVAKRVRRAPNVSAPHRFVLGTIGVVRDAVGFFETSFERLGGEEGGDTTKIAASSVFVFVLAAVLVAHLAGVGFVGGGASGTGSSVGNNTTGMGERHPGENGTDSNQRLRTVLDASFFLNEAEAERLIYEEANEIRAENDLDKTRYIPALSRKATEHAENMARNDYVGHVTPSGENVGERYAGACSTRRYGENAASAPFGETLEDWDDTTLKDEGDVAEFVVRAWMGSEGHRSTLLNTEHDGMGVGVDLRDDGTVFVVQAFC